MKTKSSLSKKSLSPEQEIQLFRAFASWSKQRKYDYIRSRSKEQALRLKYTWAAWARDSQLAPAGSWSTWCVISGRGWGKTRCGAEWVVSKAWAYPGCHIALVGRTVADVRDVMVKGRSGILSISPPWFKPTYYPSKRQLVWPNGSYATTYSADEPDQLRGPQHSFGWADERAAWQYDDAWDQLGFGLRIEPAPGIIPQCVVTTTPRNTKAMRDLVSDPSTVVTRRSTYENRENLSPRFLREIERKYAGTRLGRQEIDGEIIDDVEGALWKREWIEQYRVRSHPELKRIVVALDPPASHNEGSAEAGIVVAGVGLDDQGYVLADRSRQGSPNEWAGETIAAYYVFQADVVVGEINNGGDMIETILRNLDKAVSYKSVRATHGKLIRAEPVSSLYERGLIHHVGTFAEMEDQQCNWVPGEKSPDRLDANVWALTELMLHDVPQGGMLIPEVEQSNTGLGWF